MIVRITDEWRWKDIVKELRVNRAITAPTVRLVDHDGSQIGIIPIEKALEFAERRDLDLVEVAPNANPPVCRVMDYGKYRYQQSKKMQEAKKKQTIIQVKEIKFRPRTNDHDLEHKMRSIYKFLKNGDKIKITVRFRGRELSHTELASQLLEKIKEAIGDLGVIEQEPRMDGRLMVMMVAPRHTK